LKGQNNGAGRNCPLLGNGSINMYYSNGHTGDNRGTVGNGVFYEATQQEQWSQIPPWGPNTSTVALQVIGGDGKGTQCLVV
jgi:hypothetical protein